MPYKHETEHRLIPRIPNMDRRIKLTDEQREEIRSAEGVTVAELARKYKVSRRTIQFIVNPEAKANMLARREERGGWKSYYDREKHVQYVAETRKHRTALDKKNLLIENPKGKSNDKND